MIQIEATLQVDQPTILSDLRNLTVLGPFTLMPTPGIEAYSTTYFDTVARQLAAQCTALYISATGQRRHGVLKRWLYAQGVMQTRDEWQIELGANEDPYAWPASEAREYAIAALDGAAAIPLIVEHTQRQYMYAIRTAEIVAELALDQGTIAAGGQTTRICEIEIKLLEGQLRADLEQLIDLLQSRYQLDLVPQSRYARGLKLLGDSDTELAGDYQGYARAVGSQG